MIAQLSLVIFLTCSTPDFAIAELGGVPVRFEIEPAQEGPAAFQLENPQHPLRLILYGVTDELRSRGGSYRVVDRTEGCI